VTLPFLDTSYKGIYYILTDVMKSSLLLMLLVATSAGALGAQVSPGQDDEPIAAGAVTITGSIKQDGTGFPIPFSTVRLQPIGRERFADQRGAFAYYSIAPGEYTVQVRMLGYMPLDTTIVVRPNRPVSMSVAMVRIPTSLEQVQVSAPPRLCLFPDEMGYVEDQELATILGEARKNAQREQLLRRTYPFEYRLAQSHETYDAATGRSVVVHDTVTYRSNDNWRYRKGRVVAGDRNEIFGDVRLMRLPTLADLADPQFLKAHCFKYSGIVDEGGSPAHKIEFGPDSSVIAPDVEGSIFIDSASYLIKRAQFRLTRGGTVKPAILGMEVTTTYREILPNVALFDVINSVQPLGKRPGDGERPPEFKEVQRLLSYRFIYGGPPGTQAQGHKWIPAAGDSTVADATTAGSGRGSSESAVLGPQP